MFRNFFENKNRLKNILYIVSIFLTVFLVFVIVGQTSIKSFISSMEKKTFDIRQRIIAEKKNVDKNIVIITIDDNS